MSKAKPEILTLQNVSRTFHQEGVPLEVLHDISLSLKQGEMVALVGPSGAGKSTLLQIAGLLEKPTSGNIFLRGEMVHALSDKRRTGIRCRDIGFVYQFHHLLPDFTALENVMMPLLIAGQSRATARMRALDLIEKVHLSDRLDHRPSELSGGEQQRIAIVRALANKPQVLLADEPTGNLDTKTAESVFTTFQALIQEHQMAALIATHNPDLARRMDRTVTLVDGIIMGKR